MVLEPFGDKAGVFRLPIGWPQVDCGKVDVWRGVIMQKVLSLCCRPPVWIDNHFFWLTVWLIMISCIMTYFKGCDQKDNSDIGITRIAASTLLVFVKHVFSMHV